MKVAEEKKLTGMLTF